MFQKAASNKIKVKAGQIITQNDFSDSINSKTDLLLFQSGWSKFRGKEIYSLYNPGLSSELGLWLRQEHSSIRAVGIDWVSVSSFQHRELGRKAHKAFLDPSGKAAPIVLIEDMNLLDNLDNLREVLIVPLLVDTIDSVPCTAIGIF